MKQGLIFLIIFLGSIGAQAKESNTLIDSCGTLSAIVYTPSSVSACAGNSVELSATIYPNVSSQWYKDGQPFGLPNTEVVYASEGGQYHLEVTNLLLQCNHSFDAITVQINPLPVVYAGPDVTICEGNVWYFYAGDESLNYTWSNDVPNGYPSLILQSEPIILMGIDGNGCSNSDTATVTVLPNFINYYDGDGDGFGTPGWIYESCFHPQGFVTNSTDCDDNNATININAAEICDGQDDNCNGQIDDGFVLSDYYFDLDLDGFGNPNVYSHSCFQPVGYVANATDCNDNDVLINVNASEICNGVDENCNGLADDGLLFLNYYMDFDFDGFGSLNIMQNKCYQPLGYVTNSLDCNDSSFCINASAVEVCNGIDDDCNGEVDNGIVFATFYADADNDTYGDPTTGQDLCLIPIGQFVTNGDDCDDTNALINPAASEVWENGIDDDCNANSSDVSTPEFVASSFTLFPNPAADRITLTSSSADINQVEIFNALGDLIHTSNIFGSQAIIDVSSFSAGYYLVRLNGHTKSFVKQ